MEGIKWTSGRAHNISLVGLEAHLVEEALQGGKLSLKTVALWRRNESVTGVKKLR